MIVARRMWRLRKLLSFVDLDFPGSELAASARQISGTSGWKEALAAAPSQFLAKENAPTNGAKLIHPR